MLSTIITNLKEGGDIEFQLEILQNIITGGKHQPLDRNFNFEDHDSTTLKYSNKNPDIKTTHAQFAKSQQQGSEGNNEQAPKKKIEYLHLK